MSEEWKKDIEAVIAEDDAEELLGVVIDIAMAAEEVAWATEKLIALAAHPNTDVRGNALIGFTHLASRFADLDLARVRPVLEAALQDPEQYVRDQAEAALDELDGRAHE